MKMRIHSVLLAGLLASASLLAFAQADDMGSHMGRHHMDPEKIEQMHAKHLAELKGKLKLTPEQESAWTTFSAAIQPSGDGMKPADMAEIDKLSTPERIDKMHALRKEHMAAMDKAMDQREQATKTFYAVLTAEQKKVFDAEHARHAHQMHPMSADGKAHPASKP